MRLHTTGTMYARSKYPTQLAKLSFDEILGLTADVLFYFAVYLVIVQVVGKSGAQKLEDSYIPFLLMVGSLKRG